MTWPKGSVPVAVPATVTRAQVVQACAALGLDASLLISLKIENHGITVTTPARALPASRPGGRQRVATFGDGCEIPCVQHGIRIIRDAGGNDGRQH